MYSLILAAMVLTAEPAKLAVKLETLELPKDLATAIREACSPDAVHVTEKAGALCLIWLRKDIPTKDGKVVPGTLIGAIQLHRSWSDFKTQEAPAGIYTLRYVLQPISKDHEGTAPQRDFVILVPAVEDPNLDVLPLKSIIQKSGKATGGTHPVVMLLFPYPKPAVEPIALVKGKRVAIGVRWKENLGFAFTVIGSGVD